MRKLFLFIHMVIAATLFSNVTTAQPSISYQSFITGLSSPVEVVNAGDNTNRLFIVQQNGIIRVYDPANGGLQTTPFLNMSSLVTFSGEQGLLSMAFHPDYENNGYFFVYYNNTSGSITVARYRVSSNTNIADAGSSVVLLAIPKPFTNHNGGHLQFGRDGHLYFATGDGGSGNDPNNFAQTGTSLLGKMIRINVDNFNTAPYYTVPATNPFVGNAAYDERVWALGLRNPFRWSFDRLTGDMWIGDVGQSAREEINFTSSASTGGENYGWRCYEGTIRTPGVPQCDPPNHHLPIFDYPNPAGGSSSVVGGYVYRGTEYPFFNGYYIAADVYSGTIYLIKSNGSGGWNFYQQTGLQNFVVGFGEAENGTLYAVSQATGTVYKVVASVVLPVTLINFSAKSHEGFNEINWTTGVEGNTISYHIENSNDGSNFIRVGTIAAKGAATNTYSFRHNNSNTLNNYYRLVIEDATGNVKYSTVVMVPGTGKTARIYPTLIRNGKLNIELPEAPAHFQLISSNGVVVFKKENLIAGLSTIELPPLVKGIYYARIILNEKLFVEKIVIE